MRLVIMTAAVLLAGCESMPASQASNWDICRYTMGGGNNAMVAQQEARRRGLDCTPYYPAINARIANENAAVNNFIRQMNPPVQPMPFPQPMNCTSNRMGNTVNTSCW